jgi:site-specific DNA recombinase
MQIKRAIASSIYPKKLVFDGTGFRTDEMNSITKYIFLTNSALANKKDRHRIVENSDAGQVSAKGFEPLTVPIKNRDALSGWFTDKILNFRCTLP